MGRELQRASLFLRYIREEHAHTLDIFESGKRQMLEALRYVKVDPNSQPAQPTSTTAGTPPAQPAEDTDTKHPEISTDIRRVYKRVVQETHPDKLGQTTHSEKEREKRVKLYMDAVKAFQVADADRLVEIAVDLEIETGLDETQVAVSLNARAKKLESDIQNIKTTVEWHWAHAAEDQRVSVIRELCRRNGWIYVTDDEIVASVRYATGMHPGSKEQVRERARKMMQDRRKIT